MDFDQVRNYWDQRAASDSSVQSTTQDVYLREIEYEVLKDKVKKLLPDTVYDVGCGDARTTARLAVDFRNIKFIGGDYSQSMVKNAKANIEKYEVKNLDVVVCDISKDIPANNLEMVYTTRCLVNLPSWELQKSALINISQSLAIDGHYVMIENFVDGQDNFNEIRKNFGLPEIQVRKHNLFFRRVEFLQFANKYFEVVDEVNISSTYYLVSRVLYSKMCFDQGIVPDYFDKHHEYAAKLPFAGEYGPVRMFCMKRRAGNG